jgi:tetratricopeptide (TPR) repeat protein
VAQQAAVERMLEQRDHAGAVRAARALLQKADEAAYPGAAHDAANAQWILGRSLSMSGATAAALSYLDQGVRSFEMLGETRMANVVLTDKADCLTNLRRYDEAAAAYEEATALYRQIGDLRSVAVGQTQLATVRCSQGRYGDALKLYSEALGIFNELGHGSNVATVWHRIGMVCEQTGQSDPAEHAYQESLKIRIQTDDASGEAQTLNQLGNLYSALGRSEDAVRCYRQTADLRVRLRDLRGEGIARHNLGAGLVVLRRYDEARIELERAIACKKPFGHGVTPWTTFANLSNLEALVGNESSAQNARDQALQTYLAYRRDGGVPQNRKGELIARDPAGALRAFQESIDRSPSLRAFIRPLQAILAGSRDKTFADDPELSYDDAVELLLLMERLQSASGADA